MKKLLKIIVLTILLLLLLAVATIITKKQLENYKSSIPQATPKAATEVKDDTFEEEVINSDKIVLVDFYATWCQPCKMLSPTLEEVAGEHDEIKLVKIDVDENPVASEKYQIEAMPTLVVIKNGEEVARSVGVITKQKVVDLIK